MRPLLLAALALRFAVPFGVLAPLAAHAQSLAVVSASPAPNAIGIARSAPLTVTFDRAIDPASVTAATVRVMGRWSGPVPGTLSVTGAALSFTPSRPFAAGETVTLQVARTVRGMDGQTLDGGRGWTYWAAVTPGTPDLTIIDTVEVRQTGEGNIVTYGGSAADFNGDGWGDLLVSNEVANDTRLFLNDGTGRYGPLTVVPLPNGAVPSPVETGDFDGDGDMDAVIANTGGNRVSVLLNDGPGTFTTRTSYLAGQAVRGLAVLDLDGDGIDEIVTGNYTADNVTVLKGGAGGTFGAPQALAGTYDGPYALSVADADADGRLDLYLATRPNQMVQTLLGDGDGGLTPIATPTFSCGGPWQIASGDLDNDGDADLAVAGSFCNVVTVHFADGNGAFSSALQMNTGSFVIAIDLGDLDGDGDLDLVTSNYSSRDFRIHYNLGSGTFAAPVRLVVAGAGSCALLHDRDNDGDLDVTGVDEVDDRLYLYENHSVTTGTAPTVAPSALGLALAGPNPAHGTTALRVTAPAASPARIVLYDALGRTVAVLHDGPLASGDTLLRVDVATLAPGLYVARATTATGAVSVRMAVQ
ncbi:MAG TPA: FG-GAP-like repeat-containing protein [Rhodothermales bacterium]|nr:FG-GAP-like repeat-containing protein [Rhodothermales bacterium]